jgi:hypothetical protein
MNQTLKNEENIMYEYIKQHLHQILKNMEYNNPQIFMEKTFMIYQYEIVMLLSMCQVLEIHKIIVFERIKGLKYKTRCKYLKGYNKN